MLRRLPTSALLLLAGGSLLAGCGSGGSSTSTITEAATTPAAASTTSGSGTVTAPAVGESGSSAKSPAKTTTTPAAPTTPTASTGTWNTAQCNAALIDWYKGHSGASAKEARSYKIVLGHQHQCFTAKSHTPVPAPVSVSAGTWNSVQCNAALVAWYKTHRRPGEAAIRSYKASLSRAHGCFTAASLTPRSPPRVSKR